jgi:hypothetical protein
MAWTCLFSEAKNGDSQAQIHHFKVAKEFPLVGLTDSSSLRCDLMIAHDMGIRHKVFVLRGHQPSTPYYGYTGFTGLSAALSQARASGCPASG